MKRLGIFFALFAGLAIAVGLAFAQSTPLSFTCIVGTVGTPPTECPDGSTPLSLYSSASPPTYVTVAGYFQQSDAGGGEFYRLGAAATKCYSNDSTNYATGQGTVGETTITDIGNVSHLNYLNVGELVSGSGTDGSGGTVKVQPGTEIASIAHGNITLTLPLTGTSTQSDVPINNIIFTGDNTGTLIIDSEGTRQCWQKTNYRGDPHEFGAWGDGASSTPHDDSAPMQNWFGAYGNVNPNLAPATAPPNFGPWNASIPANYMVTEPLYCPDGALIQGLATQSTGPSPLVRIFAARNPSGTSFASNAPAAVLTLDDFCRLSGVAVDGNGLQMNGTTHGNTTVDNLNSTTNIQVGDLVTAADIPVGTAVYSVGGCSTPCVTITGSGATGSNSELVSFNGPNAVAVNGSRDTIDGHSLIENGYNNVACTSTAAAGLQIKDAQSTGSGADNLALGGCPNVRVIGNVIAGAGGRGVRFGGDDITVANNTIEQSAGTGLDLSGAGKLSVNDNFLDDNGKGLNGGPAIEITNVTTASICNNHMTGNGEYSSPYPAQIHFGGRMTASSSAAMPMAPRTRPAMRR